MRLANLVGEFMFAKRRNKPQSASVVGKITAVTRGLWHVVTALLGVSAGVAGWMLWHLQNGRMMHRTPSELADIATGLAEQFSRSVHLIDDALLEIKWITNNLDIDNSLGFRAAFNRHTFRDLLLAQVARLPHAVSMGIADREGEVIVSSAAGPTLKVNVADRDYFQEARRQADGQLIISIPIYSRTTGTRAMVFARQLDDKFRGFAGLIYCGVGPELFEELDAAIQSRYSHRFLLRRSDGAVLVSLPNFGAPFGSIDVGKAKWQQSASQGSQVHRSPVMDYPLLVDVATTQ
jgi:hypothetical protein